MLAILRQSKILTFYGLVRLSKAKPVGEINEFHFETSEINYLYLHTKTSIRAKLVDHLSLMDPPLP